jgi:hypothetical protein
MNPTRSIVRHTPLSDTEKGIPACLSILDNMCTTGAQSTEVQASPVASAALAVLQKAVTLADAGLSAKQSLAQALMNAAKVLEVDFGQVKTALTSYEAAVNALANGSASIITKAGLPARDPSAPAAALEAVTVVHSKPWKHPEEARISWPAAPGATGYAIQVNFTPQTPAGPWTALNSGTGRSRVVKGPAPGAQFLVQVASLGSDGTQSAWSASILATAL